MDYLASFTDYEQKAAHLLSRRSMDIGRMYRNAERLGLIPHPFDVVHIAGSKGKGSTALFCDHILRAHGQEVGRFLSPHLVHITERIAWGGRDITTETFAELVDKLASEVEPLIANESPDVPTFFEAIALMALQLFTERRADAAVFEVGLGGRLDATNIVTPTVCLITSIDLEHTRVLGDDLASIAREKAGIIKDGIPVICGVDQNTEAGRAIADVARLKNAPLLWLDEIADFSTNEQSFSLQFMDWAITDLKLKLPGAHQLRNAALATAAVRILLAKQERNTEDRAMQSGLFDTQLPGRLQWLPAHENPLGRDILIDSAHTPDSMAALSEELRRRFPSKPVALLTALLNDKDAERCLAPLQGLVSHIFTTAAASPRSTPPADLANALALSWPATPITPTPHDIAGLLALPISDDVPLIVAGSTYLAGEILGTLQSFPRKP